MIMKKIFALVLVLVLVLDVQAQLTPVIFTLQSLTGTVNNRTIHVIPDSGPQNPLNLGTNLVPIFSFDLHPVNGAVTNSFAPWGYSFKVDGWPRPLHFYATPASAGTNPVNVTSLINTNQYSPLNIFQIGDNGTANNVTGTNVNFSGAFGGSGAGLTNVVLIGRDGNAQLTPNIDFSDVTVSFANGYADFTQFANGIKANNFYGALITTNTNTLFFAGNDNLGLSVTSATVEADIVLTPMYSSFAPTYPVHLQGDPDGFEVEFFNAPTNYFQSTVFSVNFAGNAYAYGNVYAGYSEGNNFNTNGAFYGLGTGLTAVPGTSLIGIITGNGAGVTNLTHLVFTNSAASYLASGAFKTMTALGMVTAEVIVTNSQIVWLTNATSHNCIHMGNLSGVWTNYDAATLFVNVGDSVGITNMTGTGGAALNNSFFQALH